VRQVIIVIMSKSTLPIEHLCRFIKTYKFRGTNWIIKFIFKQDSFEEGFGTKLFIKFYICFTQCELPNYLDKFINRLKYSH